MLDLSLILKYNKSTVYCIFLNSCDLYLNLYDVFQMLDYILLNMNIIHINYFYCVRYRKNEM